MHAPSTPLASPWHAGEHAMQQRVGLAERMEEIGPKIFRQAMPLQHQAFFPLLSFVVVGAVDPQGDAWATLMAGHPGFLSTPDAEHLTIAAARVPADPADAGMENGQSVGLLGIELATRRRNRLNGKVQRTDAAGFAVEVAQSFGNCPQYIRPRKLEYEDGVGDDTISAPLRATSLNPEMIALILRADTFFVASYVDTEAGRQVDVSHRGGPTGFVRVGPDGVLTVPDYSGNMFFNTLGNMLVNPKAGLVFVDFAHGGLLQLSGDAEVLPDDVGTETFRGAERLWRFTPRRAVYRPNALPLRLRAVAAGWD
jgi:predicted pyridoxine 5'-phosphate oxidase superfamily flavin-nucleotide-binding protein